jgi:hypothetical protein
VISVAAAGRMLARALSFAIGPLAIVPLAIVVAAGAAAQQNPHPTTPTGGPSSLPSGTAVIRGVIADGKFPGATAGLTVALYALQPDGTPGIGSTQTAVDGSFSFKDISNDATIVYLVGTRYGLVPYGERAAFAPGQQELVIELAVQRPIIEGADLRVVDTSLRVEALGSRLSVQETHQIVNTELAPIYVPADRRSGRQAPFRASLPKGTVDFQAGVFNADEGFEQRGNELFYWGPIYPGPQTLRYSYQLPIEAGTSQVTLEPQFPLGSDRVRVLAPETGPRVESPDLRPAAATEVEGRKLTVLEGDRRAPGDAIRVLVQVPETSLDRSALSLGRTELSIELDDTVLQVTQSHQIDVAEGAHLAGAPGDPLLRLELPLGAELVGLSTDADRFGLRALDQGIELFGPLGPGKHEIVFRYRLPTSDGAAALDLRFPQTVPTLLLRAADTGLLIESDRLHRLRPQPIGTRTWLMREAFHIEPDEVVSVRFAELERTGPSGLASVSFVLAAAAIVLLFVVSPLRRSISVRADEQDDRSGLAHERDLVYATIRDLEHDFETGKVAEQDYQQTRQELRARAVDLMREEASRGEGASSREGASQSGIEAAATIEGSAQATSGFCPACSGKVDPGWQFCSHCGGALVAAGPGADDRSGPTG